MEPSSPKPPFFNPAGNTWTLSRYADVYDALREPALVPTFSPNESTGADSAHLHANVQADMARMASVEWRKRMEREASALIAGASHGRPINLVTEIIQPWSVAMMLALNGTELSASSGTAPKNAKRLIEIAARLFYKGEPSAGRNPARALRNKWLAWHRKRAEAELEGMLQQRRVVLSKPMFSGLTQTLPSFLANAWLALLQHPDQQAKLLAEPGLMPGTTEELLRYAGIVHTRHRQASTDVSIGEAHIAAGQRVVLKLAAANCDPAKFDNPGRLDITRRPAGHLGLGTGVNACAGAVLVRSAFAAVTPLLLAAGPTLEPDTSVIWTSDSAIRWPRVITASFPESQLHPKT
jgi:cytochrome P450